jgi:hypothetical protein
MASEEGKNLDPEKVESRLAGLEHASRILMALVLVSLSCSLVALILALVTLATAD